MKKSLIIALMLLSHIATFAQGDKTQEILQGELSKCWEQLSKADTPPYYMSFRAVDSYYIMMEAQGGALTSQTEAEVLRFMPHIRVGDRMLDNYYYMSQAPETSASTDLPKDGNALAAATIIWNCVEQGYSAAKGIYAKTKAQADIDIKQEDKAPNFVDAPAVHHHDEALTAEDYTFDKEEWAVQLKKYSKALAQDILVSDTKAQISFTVNRKYFCDTEGGDIVWNERSAMLMVSAQTRAADGMELPLYVSYNAFKPSELPSEEQIMTDLKEMAEMFVALRKAPLVTPYAGPALMAGSAAGVFFHEIFGHRIEGQRLKTNLDGQTFKSMVGKQILPADMSIYSDPTRQEYNGTTLNGYYRYDDQGVEAESVEVVHDGHLKSFLMSRTGIDGFERSNGHGRAAIGYQPMSRQSNLIVESNDPKSEEELYAILREECKRQNKKFGYYFKRVSAGLAYTGANQVSAFNVTPLIVYRVYVDGRPDELVRGVDMIGTPLSIFENIAYAGSQSEVFTGTCGAESGGVPVTAISPNIFIKKVEVQRKAKSQNTPPLLANPNKKIEIK